MNLQNIRTIVNAAPENWERMLLAEIAKDSTAIPHVLAMLNAERNESNELIVDLNHLLSQAKVVIETPKLNKDGFLQEKLTKFYNTGRIKECYPK
jgi:hypothetical protein